MSYTVIEGQNIYDVALEVYGSAAGAAYLVEDNSLAFDAILDPGTVLVTRSTDVDDVVDEPVRAVGHKTCEHNE